MTTRFLIYGANGYTGDSDRAGRRSRAGQRPVARRAKPGRRRAARPEAGPRVAPSPWTTRKAVDAGIAGMASSCTAPARSPRTSRRWSTPACGRGSHYLDITGEVMVFEAVAARDAEAKAAGVMLLPGAGFDVVPSDCLAAHLHARLPSAKRLRLAFRPSGGCRGGRR